MVNKRDGESIMPIIVMLAIWLCVSGCAASRLSSRTLVAGGELRGVHSMAAGPNGEIFAASPFSNQIAVINPGTLQWKFISDKPLGMPWELAVTGSDRFVFYDMVRRSLESYSPISGATIIKRKNDAPMILTADSSGRLFAATISTNPEIAEIDPRNGNKLFLLSDKVGPAPALAPSKDGLLAALPNSRQIAKIDTVLGEFQSAAPGIEGVTSLAADENGIIWASAKTGSRPELWRIDTSKSDQRSVEISAPFNAMAAAGHKIIGSDTVSNSLWVVSPSVESPVSFYQSPLVTPGGICFTRGGLFVADQYSVKEFDPDSGYLRRTILIPDLAGQVIYPTNVSASDEFLIVTSWISGTVHLLDPASGQVAWKFGGLSAPQSAVVLPGGDVLVAEMARGQIVRLSRFEGRESVVITTDVEGPRGPCDLALAPDGGVYVTENFGGAVSFVDPYAFFYKPIVKNLQGVEGLTVTAEGDLLVMEARTQRLIRVNPKSGEVLEIAGNLPIGLPTLSGLPPVWFMSDVAVANNGDIYLSCDRENSIRVLTRH